VVHFVSFCLLHDLYINCCILDFAPSFEDMDLAIESQLYENYNSEEKSLHLTPQYQIAVNCAWLNLKVNQIKSYIF
jgi:hypothetical protein